MILQKKIIKKNIIIIFFFDFQKDFIKKVLN